MKMHRFYGLSAFMRQQFGKRVRKIPLDAGFSCPNRDGSLSSAGCVFCNPEGSGSGMAAKGVTLPDQWRFWRDIHVKKHGVDQFTGYLQSYTNTYGPIEKLRAVLTELDGLPGLASLALGTRPDCVDDAKLDLLARQKKRLGLDAIFLELGLQTADDATLKHINRGHKAGAFAEAARAGAERGLLVVAHVMAGLPTPRGREGGEELAATVEFLNGLPVHGVKFHNVYVCRDTRLAKWFGEGRYAPPTLEEYLGWLSKALMRLDPRTVVHRLNGNPAKGELLAPEWAGNMRRLHNQVRDYFDAHDIWQGKENGAGNGPAPWYDPEYKGGELMKKTECVRTEYVKGNELALSLCWKDGKVAAVQIHWANEIESSDAPTPEAAALQEALVRYEAGTDPRWPDLPFDFSQLTDFQKAALDELRRIPSGSTRTYGQLAGLLERPGGAQAVGRAMATNPFPLLYPCHRVIGADGSMTGFSGSGGVDMKEYLLRLEGALQVRLPGLD